MEPKVTPQEFALLKDLIEEETGILLGDDKDYLVESRMGPLLGRHACRSFGELYRKAKDDRPRGPVRRELMEAITTRETYWFRDKKPFVILKDKLLPRFHEELRQGSRDDIHIWSAACSSGQEPYSIAITALEFFRTAGGVETCRRQVRILATDISAQATALARAGTYDHTSVGRGLPPEYLKDYFKAHEGGWTVRNRIRQLVEFKCQNLREPIVNLGRFDVIFLRNVIIYFSDGLKKELLARVARVLKPNGYLFLGAGETLSGLTNAFELVDQDGAVYYRLKGTG
jgi:chemotaxis protein methyltransferase CheR